jgi:EAL domain-containing protein (putative c-di-GMP-specific phosphodiesterase class I)
MASNRLLVIDDEPVSSATVGRIARGCGFDSIITTDVDDFRSRIMSWNPTVLVLDLAMPEMDGIELMHWLAQKNCEAHILIITGSDEAARKAAAELGKSLGLKMAGTMGKPLRVEKLRTVFKKVYSTADVLSVADCVDAMKEDQIRLVYQPLISLATGATIGFEALARWNHPTRGDISPSTFIPLLEGSEFINDFTFHIIGLALKDVETWGDNTSQRISLNLSGASCGAIYDIVDAQCATGGVATDRIILEVTETAVMACDPHVIAGMANLHKLGVKLSIDDFGTGQSSLVKLSQLPFSELKIDKSFINACVDNRQSAILVRAMIELAHNLNMTVVAEGVETAAIMEKLREWECDQAQGYFISRPMPSNKVQPWLKDRLNHEEIA